MNKAILIGNLTRDPETTTLSGGITKCSFTVACQRRYTNADGKREADFIPVVCWRQTAELCAKYLAKGRKVAVEGTIQTRSYEAHYAPVTGSAVTGSAPDETAGFGAAGCASPVRGATAKDGTKRYVTEVIADNVEFLTSSQRSADPGPMPPPERNSNPNEYSGRQMDFTEIDDDGLPF